MKKLFFTIIAALAALLTSCSHEAEEIARITTISASTDQSTRAEVASDNISINWEPGDQLGVFGKNSSSEQKKLAYTLPDEAAGAGTSSGKFQNSSSDITTISAIMYPYQASAKMESETMESEKLTCTIPSVQTAPPGSFDKSAAIMYAFGNSTKANLSLAVNFLAITLSAENPMPNSIIITSSNPLTGMMEITSSGVSAASSGAEKSVTLTAGSGSTLTAGKEYYIAVKPGEIESPSITYIYYSDHTATIKSKSKSNPIIFAAGTNVKPISVNFTEGEVTTRKAIQLWDGGPYFAEFNVGATATSYENTTYNEACGNYNTWSKAFDAVNTWGPMWQLPTKDQLDELCQKTNWTEETGSIKGYTISGSVTSAFSSNSIFLPAAGYYDGDDLKNRGDADTWGGDIYYWSGNVEDGAPIYLNCTISSDNIPSPYTTTANVDYKYPIRPVLK